MERKKQLPPDEHRCGKTDGMGWRCKNFRNETVPKTKYCEKHYNCRLKAYQIFLKKKSGNGDAA
ncbi:hypothetical protein MKX03_020840, partial [Papaver bracteatum]